MKQAVLSLSGGMDSSSLLLHLLANGYEVTALGFDYGQKHKVELERAKSLVEYLQLMKVERRQHQEEIKNVFFYYMLIWLIIHSACRRKSCHQNEFKYVVIDNFKPGTENDR